jgi:hypothetical protein
MQVVENILDGSQSLAGTLAADYLAGRGLTHHSSPSLRFHPGLTTQVSHGTLAADYLAGRGLTHHSSPSLRFHPGLTTQLSHGTLAADNSALLP